MAGRAPRGGGRAEVCEVCERETPHAVTIELRTESTDSDDTPYTRRAYRVATCRACGATTTERADD